MRSPLERDAAGVRLQEAGDRVEERGLAGAVGADEAGDAAFRDFQRAVVDGAHAAERTGNVLDDQYRRRRSVRIHSSNRKYTPRLHRRLAVARAVSRPIP